MTLLDEIFSAYSELICIFNDILYFLPMFSAEDLITRAGAIGVEDRHPATTRTGATVLLRPKYPQSSPR